MFKYMYDDEEICFEYLSSTSFVFQNIIHFVNDHVDRDLSYGLTVKHY